MRSWPGERAKSAVCRQVPQIRPEFGGKERTMKHSRGLAIPTTLKDACDPQRMALLVYDMQVGICSQVKTADQIIARISGLLAAARSRGMRVVFTRHLSLPKTWMGRCNTGRR